MAYLSITLELGSFIFFVKVLMARANYLGAKASFYYGNLKGVKKKNKKHRLWSVHPINLAREKVGRLNH